MAIPDRDARFAADAVRYCSADLRVLEPPIPGFDRLAYGAVSLLRSPKTGEVTGLAGRRPAVLPASACSTRTGRTFRQSYALVPNGVRDALFMVRAVGAQPMIAYMTEGRLAKAVAVAAIFRIPRFTASARAAVSGARCRRNRPSSWSRTRGRPKAAEAEDMTTSSSAAATT